MEEIKEETSYWMALRKGMILEIKKKKEKLLEFERGSTRSGELVLEETMDLS